jgi:hypothetical protein
VIHGHLQGVEPLIPRFLWNSELNYVADLLCIINDARLQMEHQVVLNTGESFAKALSDPDREITGMVVGDVVGDVMDLPVLGATPETYHDLLQRSLPTRLNRGCHPPDPPPQPLSTLFSIMPIHFWTLHFPMLM